MATKSPDAGRSIVSRTGAADRPRPILVYEIPKPTPPGEVRSPVALYDVLTLSIEQLAWLEALSASIVSNLEGAAWSDPGIERALHLAQLARSHAAHWLALFREDAECNRRERAIASHESGNGLPPDA